MPIFEYRALDAEGRSVRGTALGPSLETVARDLAARGLRVCELGLRSEDLGPETGAAVSPPRPEASPSLGPFGERIPLVDLMVFFRQLGTMLGAGVGLVQALSTLGRSARHATLRRIVDEMGRDVSAGLPLSAVLSRYPAAFSPLFLGLVRSGEASGQLDRVARQIADYLEEEIALRNLIRRETFYPKVTLAASILIIGGASAVIRSLGQESPLVNPLLEWRTWAFLGPLLIGAWAFFRFALPHPSVREIVDRLLVRCPGSGLFQGFAMAKFGRAFGALHRAGVPLSEAIALAADACGNEYVRARLRETIPAVQRGESLGEALGSAGVLTPLVLDMIRTGEATGDLAPVLGKVADYYEQESQTKARQFAVMFGVAVLLLTGLLVLFIAVSSLTNIAQTTRGLLG